MARTPHVPEVILSKVGFYKDNCFLHHSSTITTSSLLPTSVNTQVERQPRYGRTRSTRAVESNHQLSESLGISKRGYHRLSNVPHHAVPQEEERKKGTKKKQNPTTNSSNLRTRTVIRKTSRRAREEEPQSQSQSHTMSFETPLPPFNAADPAATFVSASCLELMMIELVPMAYRMANEVEAAAAATAAGPGQTAAGHKEGEKEKEEQLLQRRRRESAEGGARTMDEDEERDAVFYRLESLGYRVGQGLVERYVDVSLG